MQLFEVGLNQFVSVESEVKPIRFRDWSIGGQSGLEAHIENLVVRYPGLLNFDDFDLSTSSSDELLIISQQPIATNRKRADLLAVHRDGSLVVIEIKRDAQDAGGRSESMEFQALRYAAASRKLGVQDIVGLFSAFLRKHEGSSETDDLGDEYWKALAVKRLGAHLAEEDEILSEEDLAPLMASQRSQKIYLVAASFESDATAACAWLREHGIDISAFRLRPYTISDKPILERERLIPPPELDEFMSESFVVSGKPVETTPLATQKRTPTVKPRELKWSDKEDPVSLKNWREFLQLVITRALSEGLDPEKLPISSDPDSSAGMIAPVDIKLPSKNGDAAAILYVDLHGSAQHIRKMAGETISSWDSDITVAVETVNDDVYVFPQSK